MSLIEEYSRQYGWRSWPTILNALPDLNGQLVLDLGCGTGDVAAALSARGARVIGVDMNDSLITYAKERHVANAEFRLDDVRSFRDPQLSVDGIWCSFTAAYLPSLQDSIRSWLVHLRTGGWLALTEVDDLFGHHPLSPRTRGLLNGYVENSLHHSRYDFRMGRKLAGVLTHVGMDVAYEATVPDAELSFSGPATPEVLEAWRTRFERMHLLRDFCGSEFEDVRNDFMNCLARDDHACDATVRCCIAIKKEP